MDIDADKSLDSARKEARIGMMLDKSTPRNTPSALGYANALAFNQQKKTYDNVQKVKDEEDEFSIGGAVVDAAKGLTSFFTSPIAVAQYPIAQGMNQFDLATRNIAGAFGFDTQRSPEEETKIQLNS